MGSTSRRHLPAFGLLLVFLLGAAAPGVESAGAPTGAWSRPVDGAVVRPFEAPSSVYGPGHRGVDLASAPGAPVRAVGDGEVTFAGAVAGTLHVTVSHAGGLRTSYSFLQSVALRTGTRVARGDVIGASGGTDGDHEATVLHLGLRSGDRYLDPMLLFGPADLSRVVRLAPVDAPREGAWSVADERRELQVSLHLPVAGAGVTGTPDPDDGCGGSIPVLGGLVSRACDVAGWIGDRAGAALDVGLRTLDALTGISRDALGALRAPLAATLDALRELPAVVARGLARTPAGMLALDVVEIGRRFAATVTAECSDDAPDADGTGGSMHRVMIVAGINSSGRAGADGPTLGLDASALGYHPDEGEVRWFSYADGGGAYEPGDTHGPLDDAASRLAEQLRAMQREQPGREVDLLAHSQGGVVVDVFLARHYDPADPRLPPLGTVVTVATPHEGAPLATAGERLRASPVGRAALDEVGERLAAIPPPGSRAVRELSEGSPLIRAVQRRGVPEHFDVTSIVASEDVVVPATNVSLRGATEAVVAVNAASQHRAVLQDPDGLRAMRAALEGRAPPCVGLDTALRSAVAPVVISRVEHGIGIAAEVLPGGAR